MILGINIDHIALLREGRKINDPDPIDALNFCHLGGADMITIHLREDRRHIHDDDFKDIIRHSKLPVNLECALDENIVELACEYKPKRVTFVPEKREEVTTEGGLDLDNNFNKLFELSRHLKVNSVDVSLFIDPTVGNIEASKSLEIDQVELHTGAYANIDLMLNSNLWHHKNGLEELRVNKNALIKKRSNALKEIQTATNRAIDLGIKVGAGHGLNYTNIRDLLKIEGIFDFQIGQAIIARSIFVGLKQAVRDMRNIITNVK
jgi:pyridoxine 5-phosphate synthase